MSDKKLTPEEVQTRGIVARAFGTHTVRAADQQGVARHRASRERVEAAQQRMQRMQRDAVRQRLQRDRDRPQGRTGRDGEGRQR